MLYSTPNKIRYKLLLTPYKDVIQVSLPLVLSTGSTMVMEFTDRVFLGNYSLDALAAAAPAGITAFLFASFFLGVAGYVNVFIAQYTGSGDNEGVGASLWQGIYFAILGAIFMAILATCAVPIFSIIGHNQDIQQLEVIYFRILCFGAGASLVGATLSCFYSGRGFTRTVMLIHMAGTLFNIPLDYALINGKWGLPELGIEGAAIATVSSWIFIASIFAVLIFNKKNNQQFHLFDKCSLRPDLFMRLMKYGLPGGAQFFLDILVFTFFILMVGRLGKTELAVTNLVLSINGLSYMPMWGFSIGVSTLVGQAMGKDKPDDAVIAARSTAHIALVYVFFMIFIFLFIPEPLIKLFLSNSLKVVETEPLIEMGTILLRFVALFLFFDSLVIIYSGALKGAGDSQFVMWSIISVSLIFLFVPVWFGINRFGMGLYFSWSCITAYLLVLFIIVITRYNNGKWKEIRILDH
ncbi:MAG: MATE family efflux transporter [Desulfamplus sp.]|nr:MATE family efflux transporter [Desulfamplus sp.]